MKTALITGAHRGLGLALSKQLLDQGYTVIGTTRTSGPPIMAGMTWLTCDVTIPYYITDALGYFGLHHDSLDLLINNAAIMEDAGDILTVSPGLFERTMRTNALGALLVTQAFWPYLKKAKGRVINISSSDAECKDECRPAYAVSKAALNAVTEKFYLAGVRDGVAVNHINPGWFKSDMGGEQAPISAEEAARGVLKAANL